MRYAVVLIINIILVLAGFFLLFGDPLNKQLPTKMIAIWFIVLVILDYPLRHNKIYKEKRTASSFGESYKPGRTPSFSKPNSS